MLNTLNSNLLKTDRVLNSICNDRLYGNKYHLHTFVKWYFVIDCVGVYNTGVHFHHKIY
jgi:hypothetical protein